MRLARLGLIGSLLMALMAGAAPAKTIAAQRCAGAPGPTQRLDVANPFKSLSLALVLRCTRPETGQFELGVPGTGTYAGAVPLTWQGPHLGGTVTARFSPRRSGAKAGKARLHLSGYVDPALGMAAVTAAIGPSPYRLLTGYRGGAAPVMARVASDLQKGAYLHLYTLLGLDRQRASTQARYVKRMAAAPRVMSIAARGAGRIVAASVGYSYDEQPVTLRLATRTERPVTATTTWRLRWEGTAWRLVTLHPLPSV